MTSDRKHQSASNKRGPRKANGVWGVVKSPDVPERWSEMMSKSVYIHAATSSRKGWAGVAEVLEQCACSWTVSQDQDGAEWDRPGARAPPEIGVGGPASRTHGRMRQMTSCIIAASSR